MKRLIFLIAFTLVLGAINAQNFTAKNYYNYTGTAADTLNGSNPMSITWLVPVDYMYLPTVTVTLDEYNGSATGYCLIEGSMNNSDYYLLDTCTTTLTSGTEGLTEDGTVVYQDLSTGVAWRYLRARAVLSTTGRWNFDDLQFRAVPKP
jgi:hypothetical protein